MEVIRALLKAGKGTRALPIACKVEVICVQGGGYLLLSHFPIPRLIDEVFYIYSVIYCYLVKCLAHLKKITISQ